MNFLQEMNDAWSHADRNKIAALLSVIPGLGHLYKRHLTSGLGILLGANVLIIFVTIWLAPATFGLALILVPMLYMFSVAASAYLMPDWHGKHIGHHWNRFRHH